VVHLPGLPRLEHEPDLGAGHGAHQVLVHRAHRQEGRHRHGAQGTWLHQRDNKDKGEGL